MKKIKLLLLSLLLPAFPALANPPKTGLCSWYGPGFEGKLMANGQRFEASRGTCASWFYPLGTLLRVTNVSTGRYTTVMVTDRGPARHLVADGRIIDLSTSAFSKISDLSTGLITVQIDVVALITKAK